MAPGVRRTHWTETAERDTCTLNIVGECPAGELWVPTRWGIAWWGRRLDLRRPSHWPFYVRSRVLRRLAYLDGGSG